MSSVLIGGVGNVLLNDDGVGPYVVRLLDAQYEFEVGVDVIDLGTPAIELIDNISGRDAVILIDSIDIEAPPGTVQLYRKEDIVRQGPSVRMDPHSPALVDAILCAEMFHAAPREVLLVGIVGQSYDAGCELSPPVKTSIHSAIDSILREVVRLGMHYRRRPQAFDPGIWWTSVKPLAVP